MAANDAFPNIPMQMSYPFDFSLTGFVSPNDGIIHNIDELNNAEPRSIENANHTLKETFVDGKSILNNNSTFQIDDAATFRILHRAGNVSAFGIGYSVERTGINGHRSRWFLKSFGNLHYNIANIQTKNAIKEAIVQIIIHATTQYDNNGNCEFTPYCNVFVANVKQTDEHGVETGIVTPRFFILQLNYAEQFGGFTLFDGINSARVDAANLPNILVKLARKLYVLQELYNFNHGDLHSGNIFLVPGTDASLSPRLIDYGFASMILNLGDIEPDQYGPRDDILLRNARDMTQLVTYLHYSRPQRPRTPIETFIVSNALYAMLRDMAPGQPTHWNVTRYFNDIANTNVNAIPESIMLEFPELNSEDIDTCLPRLLPAPVYNNNNNLYPNNNIGNNGGGDGNAYANHIGGKRRRKTKRHTLRRRKTRRRNQWWANL